MKCPHCGSPYCDEDYDCVSYWGDDSPYEVECSNCDKPFVVEETVMRNYEVRKSNEK